MGTRVWHDRPSTLLGLVHVSVEMAGERPVSPSDGALPPVGFVRNLSELHLFRIHLCSSIVFPIPFLAHPSSPAASTAQISSYVSQNEQL